MVESTLSVSYDDLCSEVGKFLGYSEDPESWSESRTEEIDRYVQAGVRQFYFPPAIEGVSPDFSWSFLIPTATITTEVDVENQELPADFGKLSGDFHFQPSLFARSIVLISVGKILNYRQHEAIKNAPRFAAIRQKEREAEDEGGQRFEVMWWPTPSEEFILTYRYEAYAGKLSSEDNPYPLGGMEHSELVLESCLAVAEQRANDEAGLHTNMFHRMLAAAVERDRRRGARYFGHMGCPGGDIVPVRESIRRSGDVTYKGDTW